LTGGAMVNEVLAGSPAEKAGLKRRDIVTTIDGKKVEGPAQMQDTIRQHKPGETLSLELFRGDKTVKINVQLAERAAPAEDKKADEKKEKAPEPKKPGPGFLGVRFGPVPAVLAEHLNLEEGTAALVEDVLNDSPASKTNIQKNDVVVAIAGKDVKSLQEVYDQLRDRKEGDEIQIDLIHKGNRSKVSVTLGVRPKDMPLERGDDRLRPFRRLQPHPGFPDKSFFRGKLFWKNPDGKDFTFDLPDINQWQEWGKDFEGKFREQFKDFPQDLEKRLQGLFDHYKNDLDKFDWKNDFNDNDFVESHEQISVARLVDGDSDITIRDDNGRRTITVKKGAEVLATDLPFDKLDTLPKDIQEKVHKACDSLPRLERPASRARLNPFKSLGEKTFKI